MKKYYKFFGKYKNYLIIIGILTVLNLLFGIVFPTINAEFIDNLVTNTSYPKTAFWACVILIVGMANAITEYNITCKTKKVNELIYFDIRKHLIDHFRKISILKYRENNASYLNKRIELNVNRILSFVLDNYVLIFAQLIQILAVMIIIYFISWEILICICIILPIYWWFYKHFKTPIFEQSLDAREKTANLFQTMNEQLEYMEDIIIESNYTVQDNILKRTFEKYYESVIKYTKTIAQFKFAQGTFTVMFQVLVFLVGGYFVVNGRMSIGQLTMITTYFSLIMSCVSYYTELAKNLQIVRSSITDMNSLFEINELDEGSRSISTIENVSAKLKFSYSPNMNPVLDVDFSAKKGECIGIIGTNGSGKTTLTKLLIGSLRGDKYDDCEVEYNSMYEISKLNSVELRNKNISYIPQKIRYINIPIREIFNEIGTFENPSSLKRELTEKGITITLDIFRFLEEVWNKKIDDLSGGDKQLIIIIKAILKGTSMLIFDEPSSNLDKERIKWLKETIMNIKMDKIIFIISHDKSLFDIFDRTLQLSNS